ncbi:MAG: DMT family transporter [Alphaproteobacteria bacterium]|nr:DMT family transporter [Alphaproteobacteria bacterium]
MNDSVVTIDVAGKPASLPDAFVIRVPYRLGAILMVVMLGIIWGLQYSTAKMVSLEDTDALAALLAIHAVLASLFAASLAAVGRLFRPGLRQISFFLVVALFGNVLPLGIELFAAHHVSAGELALIISLTPVAVLVFAYLLRTELLSARKLVGILIGCTAGATILLPEAFRDGSDGLNWTLIAFIGPVACGFGGVLLAKHWPDSLDTLQVATGNLTAGTLLLLPVVALTGGLPENMAELGGVANWSVIGFGFTVGMEFYLLALITRLSGAAFASCSDFVAICAGLGWGYLFFAEVPTIWMVLAACLCGLAVKLAADGTFAVQSVKADLV